MKTISRYGVNSSLGSANGSSSVDNLRAGSTNVSEIDKNPYGNTRQTLLPKIKPQSQSKFLNLRRKKMEPESASQALQKISRGSMMWSRSSVTAPMINT